ncbi:hypothetical protein Pcinc_007171 [Petrolisthes cinctipes]|uniref:Uncharacterized protein n=1 Tax=Petrolisthes cinctipes TaxID=88211 RepID=A0AAE1KYT8_PETCI|nr:hypothetical protein Pcinc_007171 [Petrolisthes cinctipes]
MFDNTTQEKEEEEIYDNEPEEEEICDNNEQEVVDDDNEREEEVDDDNEQEEEEEESIDNRAVVPANEYYSTVEKLQENFNNQTQEVYSSIIDKYTCLAHGLTPSPSKSRKDKSSLKNYLENHKPDKKLPISLLSSFNGSLYGVQPNSSVGTLQDDDIEKEVESVLQKRKAKLGLLPEYELKAVDSPCVSFEKEKSQEDQIHVRTRPTHSGRQLRNSHQETRTSRQSKKAISGTNIKDITGTKGKDQSVRPLTLPLETSHRKKGRPRKTETTQNDRTVPEVWKEIESDESCDVRQNVMVKKCGRSKGSSIDKSISSCQSVIIEKPRKRTSRTITSTYNNTLSESVAVRNRDRPMKTTRKVVKERVKPKKRTNPIKSAENCVKLRGKLKVDHQHSLKSNNNIQVNPKLKSTDMTPRSAAGKNVGYLFSVDSNQVRIILTKKLGTVFLPAQILQLTKEKKVNEEHVTPTLKIKNRHKGEREQKESLSCDGNSVLATAHEGDKGKPGKGQGKTKGKVKKSELLTSDIITASKLTIYDLPDEEEKEEEIIDVKGRDGKAIRKSPVSAEKILTGDRVSGPMQGSQSDHISSEADHCLEEVSEIQERSQVPVIKENDNAKNFTKEKQTKKQPSDQKNIRQTMTQESKQPLDSVKKDEKTRLRSVHTESHFNLQLSPEEETGMDSTQEEEAKSPDKARLRPTIIKRPQGNASKEKVAECSSSEEKMQSKTKEKEKTRGSDTQTVDQIKGKHHPVKEKKTHQECQTTSQEFTKKHSGGSKELTQSMAVGDDIEKQADINMTRKQVKRIGKGHKKKVKDLNTDTYQNTLYHESSLQSSPEKITDSDSTQKQTTNSSFKAKFRPIINHRLTRERGYLVIKLVNVDAEKKRIFDFGISPDAEDNEGTEVVSKKRKGNCSQTSNNNNKVTEKKIHQENQLESDKENTIDSNLTDVRKTHQKDQSLLQKRTKQTASQDRWNKREYVLAGIDAPNKRKKTSGGHKRNRPPEDQCHIVSSTETEEDVLIFPTLTRKTVPDKGSPNVHDEPCAKRNKSEDFIAPSGVSNKSRVTSTVSVSDRIQEEREMKNNTNTSSRTVSRFDRTTCLPKPSKTNLTTTTTPDEPEEDEEFHRLESGSVSILSGSHHTSLRSIIRNCFGSHVLDSQSQVERSQTSQLCTSSVVTSSKVRSFWELDSDDDGVGEDVVQSLSWDPKNTNEDVTVISESISSHCPATSTSRMPSYRELGPEKWLAAVKAMRNNKKSVKMSFTSKKSSSIWRKV